MKVYRKDNSSKVQRAGYTAHYIADIELSHRLDTAGVILVDIPKGTKTTPHAHRELEELFIALNVVSMGVGDSFIDLKVGDIVLVEPGEKHWFESSKENEVRIIAIKLPNLKDDKIE